MRFRTPLLFSLVAVATFVVPLAAHAAIPFFGPIIPQTGSQASCAGGWGMLITVINNIIELLLTLMIVLVAPLTIAYAGFLLVVNPFNAGAKAQAKGILLNTVIGMVVAFAGWMIVDAVMAVLYHPTDPSLAGTTWSQLITSDSSKPCIELAGSLRQVGPITPAPGVGVTTGVPQVGQARAPCADGNTACSVGAITKGAQALNMSLTDTQKTAMSCIAMTESTGNPYTPDSSSGACGT